MIPVNIEGNSYHIKIYVLSTLCLHYLHFKEVNIFLYIVDPPEDSRSIKVNLRSRTLVLDDPFLCLGSICICVPDDGRRLRTDGQITRGLRVDVEYIRGS